MPRTRSAILAALLVAGVGTTLVLDETPRPDEALALVGADARPASVSVAPAPARAADAAPPLVAFAATPDALPVADVAAAAPSDKAAKKKAKKLAKLDKKLAKAQKKLAKLEAKTDALDAQADALEAELLVAQDLPDDDPKDAKKKAKLIAKLQKKLAKLGVKDGKLVDKQVDTTDKLSSVASDIEALEPGHTAGAVSGLVVAEQMSVVTADSGLVGIASSSGFAPDSDYESDPLATYVWDEAMEPISQVNTLLCYMAMTGYDRMVNRGAYLAQVDEAQCETGVDKSASSSEQGQSSGAGADAPALWTVSSSRGSEQSIQLVEIWVPQPDDPQGGESPDGSGEVPGEFDEQSSQHIRAKMVIHEGKSEANPFGAFSMDWARFDDDGKPQVDDGFGNLRSLETAGDFLGFTMYDGRGDVEQPVGPGEDAFRVRVNARMAPDLGSGFAKVSVEQRFGEFLDPEGGEGEPGDVLVEQDYLVAFDETHMLRDDGETTQCFSRTQFRDNVWRYGLYHASGDDAGQRVERQGGFGFETESGHYGWASYHGVWAPEEADLQTGDVVTKDVWGEESDETYTVFVAPGRLIRNTRTEIPLVELDGVEFEWFEHPLDEFSEPQLWRIRYDHGTGEWLRASVFDHEFGQWSDVGQQQLDPVDVEAHGWLSLWADGLGGAAHYEYGAPGVTVWSETFVDGDDPLLDNGDLTLFGYHDVIAASIDQEAADTGDVFLPVPGSLETPHELVFDSETLGLSLVVDGQATLPVGFAEGVEPTSGPYTWGVRSGPLLADTSGLASVGEVWSATEFYTYETGPHSWNTFTALVDGQGAFVSFDPPLEFAYKHSVAKDANGESAGNGQTFLLSYHGHGELVGIPFDPVDLDEDGFPDRWYPRFNIADGTLLGPEGDEYVVRAIDTEVTLQADPDGCDGLDVSAAAALVLPDVSDWTLPDIGDEPDLDSAPAVIDGELQELAGDA